MQFPDVQAFLLQGWDRRYMGNALIWLAASLGMAAFLSLAGLKIAFSEKYVIQGDARQYSLFFHQIKDEKMFRGDLIAQYYNSVIPSGYKLFYRGAAWLGIDPFILNKVVPLLLALLLTCYLFLVTVEIFPVPLAGFLATVLLNQNLWTKEDLSNGTPRSFAVPLFLPFLYYLMKRSWMPCVALIVLQALFFPPTVMVSLCLLTFRLWDKAPKKKLSAAIVLIAAFLTASVLVPYSLRSSKFGPVVTRAEAMNQAAFLPGGRQTFFESSPWNFWFSGASGIFPYQMRPTLIWTGLLLPFLWKWKSRPWIMLRSLAEVLIASLLMFAVAHLLLFQLYNPGRYTQHTFPIVFAVAAGISLTIILLGLFHYNKKLGWAGVLIGSVLLIVQLEKTLTHGYGYQIYVKGHEPELYRFLHSHARNRLVASLSRETDNLPPFGSCATLVGWEYTLPYHSGYFRQIQQRGEDLIRAQYDEHLTEMKSLIRKYDVEFVLVDRNAFQPNYFSSNVWVRRVFQDPASNAETKLKQRVKPALAGVMDSCAVWENERLVLLGATCIVQSDS